MEDKLELLYNSYIENGLLSSKTTFEQFSNADKSIIENLYNEGVSKNIVSSKTDYETFESAWAPSKKKEETLAPTGSDLEASGQPATGTPALESDLTSQPSEPFISRLPSAGSMSSLPSELKDKVKESLPESDFKTPEESTQLPAKGKSDPNAPKQPLDKSQYYLDQGESKEYTLNDIMSAKNAGMSVEEYTAKAGTTPTAGDLPTNEQREKFLKERSEFRENYIKEAYIDEIVKTGLSKEDAEKNLTKLALNNYIVDPEGEGITKDPVANLKDVDKDEIMAYRDKLAEQQLSLSGKTLKDKTLNKLIEKNDGDVEVAEEKFFEGMNAISESFLSDSEKQIKGLKESVYRLESFENLPEEKRVLLEKGKAELQRFIDEGLIGSKDLFDYKTGQFVSGNTKDEQIIAFNNKLKEKKSMYEKTDLGQLIKDRDDSYFKFEAFLNQALEENLDLPGLSGGEKIYWAKRFGLIGQYDGIAEAKFVKFSKDQAMQIIRSQADSPLNFSGFDVADSSISDSMKIINSEVLDPAITKKAEEFLLTFMATNSQIALNEDRSSREKYMDFQKYTDELRKFGGASLEGPAAVLDMMSGTGIGEGLVRGIKEGMGGTSMSELDQSRRAIETLSSMGYDLTDDQKEVMEVTTAEKFSEAAGGMVPVMVELAATSMVTGGISNAFKIPKLLKAISGGRKALEKGLKFSYNMGMQGLNYELAGQSFSSGVGEFLGESVGEGLIKALGSKNPLLNVLSKAIVGAAGETMAEYSGEFVERLVEDDDTFSQALDKTIGTAETAGEELATTYFLSLLMSSTMGMTGVNAEWRKDIEDTRRDLESQAEDSELIRNVLDKTKGLESNLRVMAEAEKRIRERDGLEPDAEISEKDLMSEVSTIMNEGNKKINDVISSSISDVLNGDKSLADAFDEASKTTGADLIIEEQFGKLETEADKKAAMLLMAYNADAKTKSNPEFVNWYKATEKELSGLENKSEIVEAALAVQEQDNINQQKQGSQKADIEKRRREELAILDAKQAASEKTGEIPTDENGNAIRIKEEKQKTNSKYDAELAALEQDNINQQKQTDDVQEQQTKDVEVGSGQEKMQEPDVEQEQEKEVGITPENSSNYANMTEDGEGNFVFYHVGGDGYESIKPSSGKGATSKTEKAALSKVGGLAMYYTAEERGVKDQTSASGTTYAVKIPKDKVYDANTDPLNLEEEARKRHAEEHPGKAFDANTSNAYITKIAGERGFDMVVSQWNNTTRAQTTKELSPSDMMIVDRYNKVEKGFDNRYRSNKSKGFESIIPESKQDRLQSVYEKANKERNKQGVYDSLYHLYSQPLSSRPDQDSITEMIEGSDISEELKQEYRDALAYEPSKRRSKLKVEEVKTDPVSIENSPKGTFVNIGMIKGTSGSEMTSEEILSALPNDVEILQSSRLEIGENVEEPTLSLELSRPLTDGEMKSLRDKTEQLAVPQISDGKGVMYGTLDWGDFNPEYFVMPNKSKLSESAQAETETTSDSKLETKETFELDEDVVPEATGGALDLLDAFGKKPKKSKVDPKKRKQVLDQVAKAEKALSKISPKTKIVVHETSKDYKSSGRNRNQNEGGVYEVDADGNGTIHINLESANERTVAHEVFHALLLSEGMGDKQAQAITNKMLEAVKKSASPELLVELERFSKKYVLEDENGNPVLDKNGNTIPDPVQSEESIAELFGILAAGYPTLPKPTQNIIKRWLDKLAKLFGLKLFTDNEVVDMLNTVSRSVREGSVIEESDIDVIRRDPMLARDTRADFLGGIPVDELTDADLDQNQTRQWGRKQVNAKSRSQKNKASSVEMFENPDTLKPKREANGRTKVIELGKAFDKRAREKGYYIPIPKNGVYTDSQLDNIAEAMTDDVQHQLLQDDSGIGWYDLKTRSAMELMSRIHPELSNPNSKAHLEFTLMVALISQNNSVGINFRQANEAYTYYKNNGKLPNKPYAGKSGNIIKKNIALAFEAIKRKGWKEYKNTLQETKTVKEWEAEGYKVNGENKTTEITGAMVMLGSKIGSFWGNLNGDFNTLTADLWFSRNFNRYTGNVVAKKATEKSKQTTLDELKKYSGKTLLNGYKKSDILKGGEVFDKWLNTIVKNYADGGYKDKQKLNVVSNTHFKNIKGELQDIPRGGKERNAMRNVVKKVQDKLIERGYPKLDIADIQAILWYNEKDLYRQYKAVNKSSEKTDYETAAQEVLREQGVNAEVALQFKRSESSADGGRNKTDGTQPKSLSEKVENLSTRSRKQKPSDDRPSIGAVRKKAKELGVSEKDVYVALRNMGYTNAEIRSTEAKSIADAKDKYDLSIKRGNSKADALKSAVGDLKSTYWYENASDTQRETAIRELRKELGAKEKKAPSKKKILGEPKDKKVTMTERSALKSQIRMEARAARDSKRDQDKKRSAISSMVSDIISRMRNDAKVKSRKLNAIQKKINRTNLNNPVMVERLIRYINNVMEDVNYSAKLSEANKNRSRMKKMTKSKKRAANLRASADEFALIDPSMVTDIDEYLDRSREIVAGLSPTSITPDKIKVSDKFNSSDIDSYINSQLKSQRAKMREALNEHFEEVTGISGDEMTISEMIKAIEESKDTGATPEMLEPITKANIKKAYDSYSSVVLEMAKTNSDPFTGESLELSDSEIDLAKKLANLDVLSMSKEEAVKAVDAMSNFLVNQSLAGVESIVSKAEGNSAALKLADKGIKSRPLKLYFSKRIGRMMAEQFTSLPIALERMFGNSKARLIQKASGLSDVIRGHATAKKESSRIIKSYTDKFSKKKPNGEVFNSSTNINERGLVSFMSRSIEGNEQAEFDRRKNLIKESIEALKKGTEADVKRGENYQEVYDKLLKDSNSITEVRAKADKTNVEAVDWWVNEWSKHYDDLRKTNLEVYNELLDKDLNYTPDTYKKIDLSEDVDMNKSSFFNANDYLDKSKSGSLREVTRPNSLPKNSRGEASRYISLDFDMNNANIIQSALTDINTASPIMKLEGFLNSDGMNSIVSSKEDKDFIDKRIKSYVRNVKGSNFSDRSELDNVSKPLEILASLGVSRALGGVTQSLKQSVPVAVNTIINSGRLDLAPMFDPDTKAFIENSGMPIANRGIASQASLDHINRLVEAVSDSKPKEALKKLEDLNRFYLKIFLQNADVFIARASFISYYKQGLKKQGINIKDIDFANHEPNKDALDFAQQQVDRQQNVSDEYLQGEFFTGKDPTRKIIRKVALPFANFAMNQKARMNSDIITLTSSSYSKEDKITAARSLAGLAGEMAMFYAVSSMIRSLIWGITSSALGYEESEEDKKKRMEYELKGIATNFVRDAVSPLPMLDAPIMVGANKVLNLIQGEPEDEEENFQLYEVEDKSFLDDWGVLGIVLSKADDMLEKSDMAITGEYETSYYKRTQKYELTDKGQKNMQLSAALSILYNIGALPSEFGTASNNIEKIVKKKESNKKKK